MDPAATAPAPLHVAWARTLWYKACRDAAGRPALGARASASPREAVAGRQTTVRVLFTAGPEGVPAGGKVLVEVPMGFGGIYNYRVAGFLAPLGEKPGYGASVTVRCSNPSVRIDFAIGHTSEAVHTFPVVDVVVGGSGLSAGDTVEVVVGDPEELTVQAPEFAMETTWTVLVDWTGKGDYRRIPESPKVRVVADRAAGLGVVAPPLVAAGEGFRVKIAGLDEPGRNVSPGFSDAVALESLPPGLSLPARAEFGPADGGRKTVSAEAGRPGTYAVLAWNKERALIARSNPIRVQEKPPAWRVFFGDIHIHTIYADGIGEIEEAYEFGRDAKGLDFCAVSEHDTAGRRGSELLAERAAAAVRRYHDEGRYVTILGYEWSRKPGHRNVYFPTDDFEPFFLKGVNEPEALVKRYEGREVLIIPHHPKFLAKMDWSFRHDGAQRLVEIFSQWGCSEEGREHSVVAGLKRGQRLGIIAGTDNHFARPGAGRRGPRDGAGLAAVLAKDLTRASIWEALRARRTYATTGARILLDFTVAGAPVGTIHEKADPEAPRRVRLSVAGQDRLASLEILKNGEVAASHPAKGYEDVLEWEDRSPLGGETFYYARVLQEDGERAWSSPIWLIPTS